MKAIYTPYAVTVSAISSGPPSSPSTGDIWIATNVDANGTRWQFQYNAGSASAYKWEFIGGPPSAFPVHDSGGILNGGGSWTDTGGNQGLGWRVYVDFNAAISGGFPRSGDYIGRATYLMNTSVAQTITMQVSSQSNTAGNNWTSLQVPGAGWCCLNVTDTLMTGMNAGFWVGIGVAASSPGSLTMRWNSGGIIPVRVS